MPKDPFTRPTLSVDRALVMACSRRTRILTELRNAQTAVEDAEAGLLAAEQVKLMRERHLQIADREITGLLDERLRSVEPEQVAERMVDAG
jgi:hypothetical protein